MKIRLFTIIAAILVVPETGFSVCVPNFISKSKECFIKLNSNPSYLYHGVNTEERCQTICELLEALNQKEVIDDTLLHTLTAAQNLCGQSGFGLNSDHDTKNPRASWTPCVRKLDEFEKTDQKSHAGGNIGIYRDKKDPSQIYMIKEDWKEACASSLFQFLLGEHSQSVCYIDEPDKVVVGIKMDPTFISSDNYHIKDHEGLEKPLLPVGSGLDEIIVASILLGEADLKGLASNDSNLGIIEKNGKKTYYKIDGEQSLFFNNAALRKVFDLSALKRPTNNMPMLKHLGLEAPKMRSDKVNAAGDIALEALTERILRSVRSVEKPRKNEMDSFLRQWASHADSHPQHKWENVFDEVSQLRPINSWQKITAKVVELNPDFDFSRLIILIEIYYPKLLGYF